MQSTCFRWATHHYFIRNQVVFLTSNQPFFCCQRVCTRFLMVFMPYLNQGTREGRHSLLPFRMVSGCVDSFSYSLSSGIGERCSAFLACRCSPVFPAVLFVAYICLPFLVLVVQQHRHDEHKDILPLRLL